jgi:hypothetical protein
MDEDVGLPGQSGPGYVMGRPVDIRQSLVHSLMHRGDLSLRTVVEEADKLEQYILHGFKVPAAPVAVTAEEAAAVRFAFDADGRPTGPIKDAPEPALVGGLDVVTKHYADGTSATGSPDLPDHSPDGAPLVMTTAGPPVAQAAPDPAPVVEAAPAPAPAANDGAPPPPPAAA